MSRAFAEAWNGSAWQMQTAAVPAGAKVSGLASVVCQSPTACTAVGNTARYQQPAQTVAESWNGAQWQLQSTQDASTNTNKLLSVSCPSASTCTAVGYYDDTPAYSDLWPSSTRARAGRFSRYLLPAEPETCCRACPARRSRVAPPLG